jgi:hypothetical protein
VEDFMVRERTGCAFSFTRLDREITEDERMDRSMLLPIRRTDEVFEFWRMVRGEEKSRENGAVNGRARLEATQDLAKHIFLGKFVSNASHRLHDATSLCSCRARLWTPGALSKCGIFHLSGFAGVGGAACKASEQHPRCICFFPRRSANSHILNRTTAGSSLHPALRSSPQCRTTLVLEPGAL